MSTLGIRHSVLIASAKMENLWQEGAWSDSPEQEALDSQWRTVLETLGQNPSLEEIALVLHKFGHWNQEKVAQFVTGHIVQAKSMHELQILASDMPTMALRSELLKRALDITSADSKLVSLLRALRFI